MKPLRMLSVVVCLCLIPLLGGCNWSSRDIFKESQEAAKNWFSVIRGAQVFPLNPLRQDLKPGDVFLVTQTIEQQSDTYQSKGYLPLDQHYWRLDVPVQNNDPLPMAAMPSISFTVDRSAGGQLSLPINGIPTGFGMVASNNVDVTLAISNATYNASYIANVYPVLTNWAKSQTATLKQMRMVSKAPLMLRVVTQVYYAKSVTVSITGLDSGGASLTLGDEVFSNSTLINLLKSSPEGTNATKWFNMMAGELGKVKPLQVKLPSGRASYMRTGSNSITMEETFEEPLAVGYTGFDVVIDMDGTVGPPMGSAQNVDGLFKQPATSKDVKELVILEQYVLNLKDVRQKNNICTDIKKQTGAKYSVDTKALLAKVEQCEKRCNPYPPSFREYCSDNCMDPTKKKLKKAIRRLFSNLRQNLNEMNKTRIQAVIGDVTQILLSHGPPNKNAKHKSGE